MASRPVRHWLMKSEPDAYSIDTLKEQGTTPWDGIRNYRARNLMRDEMKVGDRVLFYHSNAKPPGVVGLARVCAEAHDDPSQFDRKSKYYDPKSDPDAPRWQCVDVEFVEKFPNMVSLQQMRDTPELADMWVIRKGMRLSVQPVEPVHFKHVLKMAGAKTRVR